MKIDTFGEYIRKLREEEEMPLRKLAAALDLDQSTLSKIERNERRPTKEMVPLLAKTFKLDKNQLMIGYLTDKITYELADEEVGLEALKAAEQQIEYQVKASMGLMSTKNIIPIIAKYLSKQPIEKAWLFGSFARNEQDIDSDIDLMVRFRKPKKIGLFDYIGIYQDLEEILGVKVDMVEEGCVRPHAAESVDNDRIVIYERGT